jgi:hypothetical protein
MKVTVAVGANIIFILWSGAWSHINISYSGPQIVCVVRTQCHLRVPLLDLATISIVQRIAIARTSIISMRVTNHEVCSTRTADAFTITRIMVQSRHTVHVFFNRKFISKLYIGQEHKACI